MKVSTNKKISTVLTKMFGLRYPIICAPMFLVSNTAMVIASAASGILGAFPALNYRPYSSLANALQEIKVATDRPFAVNLIVQSSNRHLAEQLAMVIDHAVPLIITSLGNPGQLITKAQAAGIKVFCDVVSIHHARKVLDLGADGLIAVASGAGGHAGNIASFSLIPSLTSLTDRPVIAAGGIADGRGLLASLGLGAAGAYMGTRFIASQEAAVSIDYQQAIINAEADDIVNTKRVDGYPGNFIKTTELLQHGIDPPFIEQLLEKNKTLNRLLVLYRTKTTLMAGNDKKISYRTVYSAGQAVSMINDIQPIATIVNQTVTQYHQLKKSLP